MFEKPFGHLFQRQPLSACLRDETGLGFWAEVNPDGHGNVPLSNRLNVCGLKYQRRCKVMSATNVHLISSIGAFRLLTRMHPEKGEAWKCSNDMPRASYCFPLRWP